jgi:hypothetical protein
MPSAELDEARAEIVRLRADNEMLRARVRALEAAGGGSGSGSGGDGADSTDGDAILEKLQRAIGTINDVAGALTNQARGVQGKKLQDGAGDGKSAAEAVAGGAGEGETAAATASPQVSRTVC